MSQKKTDKRYLAELNESERADALTRYEIIAPLLEAKARTQKLWQKAAEKGKCSEQTVRRWVGKFEDEGLAGLARKKRKDKKQRRVVTQELARTIEALYLEKGQRSIKNVHRLVKKYATNAGLTIPTYATVYAICKALPANVVTMGRRGETAWRDQFEAVTRFESSRPNECWQMDHCQLDILVVSEDGERVLGRPWLTVALDTYSRAIVGYYLSLTTPTSLTICFALRRAILSKPTDVWPMCGIPDQLHLDNGSDFSSSHLAQVAADLQIRLTFATPYLARAKGKVERFFDTLNQQLWSELPGYVAGSIEARPYLVQPQLTCSQVETYLLAYLLNHYHKQSHGTTGQPPLQRWQQADFTPRIPTDVRELDLLLMMTEERVVQRTGIRFYHLDYWSYELGDLVGERVLIRYDPENIQQLVVYHANQFICLVTNPQLAGIVVNLADWRALQARRRRNVKEIVTGYEKWLAAKREMLVPLITAEELDEVILIERTIAAAHAPTKVALIPNDRQPKLLTSGEVNDG